MADGLKGIRVPPGVVRAVSRAAGPMIVGRAVPISVQRRMLDAMGRMPLPRGTSTTNSRLGGVPCEWVVPADASATGMVLYLHGGGYVLGSAAASRPMVARLAAAAGLRVVVPHYRLAPEHGHPAALEDASAVYQALVDTGVAAHDIALAGDSAGGGIALALAMALRDSGAPLPSVVGLVCPWLDLTAERLAGLGGRSQDPLLKPALLRRWARAYGGVGDGRDPRLSPLLGDLSGLPPLVVHSAEQDPLLGDAVRLEERAREAGVEVEHRRHRRLWHDFHALAGIMAEADTAIVALASSLRRALSGQESFTPRVGVVGAGFSGLCMGATLRRNGLESFTIYEKADEVGGTWRENRYPGLFCDAPARYYSYSFAPNPGWTGVFVSGPEIWQYTRTVADELDLRRHIRTNAEVTTAEWTGGRWYLEMSDGHRDVVDVLVCATGFLHHPSIPDIPGRETFAGESFHSARWDATADVDGRRVAVIGTGSTGVQLTCGLIDRVAKLSLFQRTAQWILPVPNHRYSGTSRRLYARIPSLSRLSYRAYQVLSEDISGVAVVEAGWQRSLISAVARLHLRLRVGDAELRRGLTPDYQPLCKRMVVSSGFYPAIQRPNAELVTERIDHIEPRGIVTQDQRLHEVDVIVFATGFDAHAYMRPMAITGEDGITLDEAWAKGATGYRTVALPSFPNLFMMVGPNSPVGSQSVIAIAEAQATYIQGWIQVLRQGRVVSVSPTKEAADEFNAAVRAAMPDTVWATGCNSWYLGEDGVADLWPWTPKHHREMLGPPRFEHFSITDRY